MCVSTQHKVNAMFKKQGLIKQAETLQILESTCEYVIDGVCKMQFS